MAALTSIQTAVKALSIPALVLEPYIPKLALVGDGMNTAAALVEGCKAAKQVLLETLVATGHMRKEKRPE